MTVATTLLATSMPAAILVVLLLGVSAGSIFLFRKGTLSKRYGVAIAIGALLAAFTTISELREDAAKEQRMADLRANKDQNFARAKQHLETGSATEALDQFQLVSEVDPQYPGLEEEMTKAREALDKRQETSKTGTEGDSRTTQPRSSRTQTFTLSDGSHLEVSNIRAIPDWACGVRREGKLQLPSSQALEVVLYFDRQGNLFSVNALQAGNERLYDNSRGRECLMNWKTRQMELLTKEE